MSWGQYVVYQIDRSVYVYDMETQTSKKLFTHDPGWVFYNYMILDGHVMVIGGTEATCRAWAVDIADGSVIELDTYGENVVAFSAHYECNGYFVGLLHASNNADKYYISKEDILPEQFMTRLSADLPFRNEGGGHVDQSKNAEPAACSSCRDSDPERLLCRSCERGYGAGR